MSAKADRGLTEAIERLKSIREAVWVEDSHEEKWLDEMNATIESLEASAHAEAERKAGAEAVLKELREKVEERVTFFSKVSPNDSNMVKLLKKQALTEWVSMRTEIDYDTTKNHRGSEG